MPLYKLDEFYPNYQDELFGGDDIKGLNIYTEENEKVGTVSGALVDDEGNIRYLIVDTGFWIFRKQILLPTEYYRSHPEAQRIYTRFTKAEVETLPEYNENELADLGQPQPVQSSGVADNARVPESPDAEIALSDDAYSTSGAPIATSSDAVGMSSVVYERSVEEPFFASDRPTTGTPSQFAYGSSFLGTETSDGNGNGSNLSTPLTPTDAASDTTTLQSDVTEVPLAGTDEGAIASEQPLTSPTSGSMDLAVEPSRTEHPASVSQTGEHIELYEEQLVSEKQRQKAGEVIIGKRVESDTAQVAVPLAKERIIIDRHSSGVMGQQVSSSAGDFQTEEIARIELFEETVDIQKHPVIREEIRIRKQVVQETVRAEEEVRREMLDIQTEGNPAVSESDGSL